MIKLEIPKIYEHFVCWKGYDYNVLDLIEFTKSYKSIECPIEAFDMTYTLTSKVMTIYEHAEHMAIVNKADLKYPIILAPDGFLLDGRHRVIKTLIKGLDTIKVIRLNSMPSWIRESA